MATRPFRRAALVALAAGAVVALVTPGTPASADPAGAPPSPTIGEYDHVAAPVPTGAVAQQARTATAANQRTATATAAATSRTLAVPYRTQVNGYWCGPATLSNMLTYLGLGWSGSTSAQQQSAANLLNTTTDGTNWYGSDNVPSYPGTSWYPMQDALNYKLYKAGKSFRYAVHALPGSPTTAQQSAYRTNLVANIGTKAMPFPINEYAAPGYQIGKQPSGMWIMHWIAANGYSASGATTVFSDPGWGAGSASSASSTKVVVAAGGRGYIA